MHQEIELADPLNVNAIMRTLPEINERESLDDLSILLSELLGRCHNLNLTTGIEACAVVRDIGFVMSSIRKLGIQPEKLNGGYEMSFVDHLPDHTKSALSDIESI